MQHGFSKVFDHRVSAATKINSKFKSRYLFTILTIVSKDVICVQVSYTNLYRYLVITTVTVL